MNWKRCCISLKKVLAAGKLFEVRKQGRIFYHGGHGEHGVVVTEPVEVTDSVQTQRLEEHKGGKFKSQQLPVLLSLFL
jgi:hypothetical protein